MFSSSDGHKGGDKDFRAAVEPLMLQYGVTLAMFGDDHNYERSYPMYNGHADINFTVQDGLAHFVGPNKTIHILAGTGGINLDGWTSPTPPPWSAFRAIANGYVKIIAYEHRMRVQFIEAESQKVLDHFMIWKPPASPTPSSMSSLLWLLPIGVGAFIWLVIRKKYVLVNPLIPKAHLLSRGV